VNGLNFFHDFYMCCELEICTRTLLPSLLPHPNTLTTPTLAHSHTVGGPTAAWTPICTYRILGTS
jgi:hypothetical protein